MNKLTLSKFLYFTVGATVGTAVTWKLLKTKYEQIAQEEIDSVKAVFSSRKPLTEVQVDEVPEAVEQPVKKGLDEVKIYHEELQKHGYVDYSDTQKKDGEGGKESAEIDRPYQISPDDFGNDNEYECIYLNYFADGTLADDDYEMIEDVGGTVGFDFFKYFGTYEDDIVWIRNDALKCDYEICADRRNYTDVV